MVLKTRRYPRDFAMKQIKLVFARGAELEHPKFQFSDTIVGHRDIILVPVRDRVGGNNGATNDWSIASDGVPVHRKDVSRAVVKPIPIFQTHGNREKTTITVKSNHARTAIFVAGLCPMNQNITGGKDSLGRYYRFHRILAVIVWLIIDQSICQGQRNETLLGAAGIN